MTTAPAIKSPARRPEPLRNGDNLTRDEFERRYRAMPDGVKAELVEGIVYLSPPVLMNDHGRPHFDWITVLGVYAAATPGIEGADNTSLRLALGSMPQPDICLTIDPAAGGQARVADDGVLVGSPELVAEVSASTASYDLHQKLRAYRRNGVGEYLVWRTADGQFDHFATRPGRRLQRVEVAGTVLRSERFPGLWIDTAALVRGDLAAALAELHRGLATPEHAAFAADLARRKSV